VIDHVVQHQGADLIMMATHGRGTIRRLLLGSVTAKVLHDVSAAVWTGSPAAIEAHPPGGYRSIVCAVGLDEEAEAVLVAAAALARSYKAQLSLVHVVEIPHANAEVDVSRFLDELVASADDTLKKWKSTLGIDAPHSVFEATTADGVCRHAIEKQADLVVAGRGRQQGTISRAWAHLYDIVRQAPCPVLSI
jgi:nucleotide-binding universal stress UspA family protein